MPLNLFIVDDHMLVIDGIKSFILSKTRDDNPHDIQIVGEATDGKAALDFLETNSVDIILLDVNLPGINGFEVAHNIRSTYPAVKILFVTMEEESTAIIQAMRLGAAGYIIKSKSQETLIQAINVVAGGSTYWSADTIARVEDGSLGKLDKEEKFDRLSKREMEILQLMVRDISATARQIGIQLFISEQTVYTHQRNIREKLEVESSREAIQYAIDNGIF